MYSFFKSNGELVTRLEHGPQARAGTTNFEIFAYFDGLDVDTLYTSASITFIKPDLNQTQYPPLMMTPKTVKFIKESGENDEFFENGHYYKGFYFNFSDIPDNFGRSLIDTTGNWTASIKLYSANETTFVQGDLTFEVVGGVPSEDDNEIDEEDVLESIRSALGMKINVGSRFFLRVVNGFPESEFADYAFNVGDILLNKQDMCIYGLNSLTVGPGNPTKIINFSDYLTKNSGIRKTNYSLNLDNYDVGQVVLVASDEENTLYKIVRNTAGVKDKQKIIDFDKFPDFTKQEIVDLVEELEENLQQQIDDNKDDADAHFSDINDKIPATASANNKLVDRDTMNSSITQNASFFRGNYDTQNDLTSKSWQTTNPSGAYYVTNNDYAIVNVDETHIDPLTGIGETWRYKAVVENNSIVWHDEYRVNNSAFTSDQEKAINSGITTEKRVGYDGLDAKKQNKVLYGADKFDDAEDGDIIVVETTENNTSLSAGQGIEFVNINGVNYVKNGIHTHTIEIGISPEYLEDNPEFPYETINLTLLSFSNVECNTIEDLFNMQKLSTMPTIIRVKSYQDSETYKALLLGFAMNLQQTKIMRLGKFDDTSIEEENIIKVTTSMTSYMWDSVN